MFTALRCRIFLAAFLASVCVFNAKAQDDVIRVKTELVSIPVTVTDKSGRFLADLKREDFSIFENGLQQDIEYFGPVDSPFTVMVLLDASGSMIRHVEKLGEATTTFIRKLRPADNVIVARFSNRVEVILPQTRRDALPSDLQLLAMGGGTAVFDAMDYAIRFMNRVKGRKAIVLFTDGVSEVDRMTAEDNLVAAEESETLIYTVRFGDIRPVTRTVLRPENNGGVSTNSGAFDPSKTEVVFDPQRKQKEQKNKAIQDHMTGLADRTGGRAFRIEKIKDLDKTFGDIVHELGRQYTLGYYPKTEVSPNERRPIRITVNAKNASVRSRRQVVFRNNASPR